jgi:hypothetical protein
MAPKILGPMDQLTYFRIGESEGFTPQMGANEGHTPQADSNQPWNFCAQAYIGESKPNEQVGSSSRQLGVALAINPLQPS